MLYAIADGFRPLLRSNARQLNANIIYSTARVMNTCSLIYFVATVGVCQPAIATCEPIGVADVNKIPNYRMTASSVYSIGGYYPYSGRLNGNGRYQAWCASSQERTEYLQVDMGAEYSVCAVATQAQNAGFFWTTSYKLQYSLDGVNYYTYKENNVEKVSQ